MGPGPAFAHTNCHINIRLAGIWKGQLKKAAHSMNQIQVDEMVYCINSKETEHGINFARFIRQGLRQNMPNSVDKSLNMRGLINRRREYRERRVRKKEKTGLDNLS